MLPIIHYFCGIVSDLADEWWCATDEQRRSHRGDLDYSFFFAHRGISDEKGCVCEKTSIREENFVQCVKEFRSVRSNPGVSVVCGILTDAGEVNKINADLCGLSECSLRRKYGQLSCQLLSSGTSQSVCARDRGI